MKRMCVAAALALALAAVSGPKASAWCKFNFGVGMNIGLETGGAKVNRVWTRNTEPRCCQPGCAPGCAPGCFDFGGYPPPPPGHPAPAPAPKDKKADDNAQNVSYISYTPAANYDYNYPYTYGYYYYYGY
jgi:hypothetical protein